MPRRRAPHAAPRRPDHDRAPGAPGRALPPRRRLQAVITIHADEVPARPWPNGGGRTRELVAGPRGGHWRWRLSLADLDADGPFSALPGVRRWFALVEGDAIELAFADRVLALQAGDPPLVFDGGTPPLCRVHGGRARALNLMLRDLDGCLAGQPTGAALQALYEPASRTLLWDLDEAPPAAAGVWVGIEAGDLRWR
nr:HutD family protein [Rubrivivax gelatinosus]